MHAADAYFEAVSGITATGASVIANVDVLPPGMLMWRSLLNGMGGIGIVVLALAILPMLQIGGMQLFRTESSDRMEKMFPRTTQIAAVIGGVFASLMFLCAICYWMAGMNGFDAINHALTTVATGGFSTHKESLAFYDSAMIEVIAIIFMISGALPLMLYYQVIKGRADVVWRDTQVRFFFAIILLVITLITTWLVKTGQYNLLDAVRYTSFNVVSIITTTGYASADYASWGTFSTVIIFMLIVVGGCTGSTSGGIKIFRFQVLLEIAKSQINRLLQPHGVFIPQFNGKPVNDSAAASVMSFFLIFAFLFMVLAVILSAMGLDFITAFSAAAQALANVGPGLGDKIGPTGSYATMPTAAKWLLSFVMIMGRLELFTVIVLFSSRFWKN